MLSERDFASLYTTRNACKAVRFDGMKKISQSSLLESQKPFLSHAYMSTSAKELYCAQSVVDMLIASATNI